MSVDIPRLGDGGFGKDAERHCTGERQDEFFSGEGVSHGVLSMTS
jgi:hypothetical protein